MIFAWLKARRRRRLLAEPVPAEWYPILKRNVRHWHFLDAPRRDRLVERARVMVAEKDWAAPRGATVTDEMRITIAAQAAVMLLGIDEPYYFDGAQTIVVHPGRNVPGPNPGQPADEDEDNALWGIAWHRGPIVLAWKQVLRCGRNQSGGMNLVVHEFAHFLDGLDGLVEGAPPLPTRELQKRWYRVAETEYLRLAGSAERGEVTLLDHYGAENLAEFFAVASECFFERPHALRERHAELYDLLATFYRQSPAEWLEDHAPESDAVRRRRESLAERPRIVEVSNWEELFARGVEHFEAGRYAEALRDFDQLLERDPRDAETLTHRAATLFQLGDIDDAIEDCDRAVAVEPNDPDARRTRAAVLIELDRADEALADLNFVLEHNSVDAEARFLRGRTRWEQGDAAGAIDDLNRVLQADPLDAEAYYYRGRAHEQRGNTAAAQADRERLDQLDPGLWARLSAAE